MSALREKKKRRLQGVVGGCFAVAAAWSATVFESDFTRTAITQNVAAQEVVKNENGGAAARPLLTMERIFASGEFGERGVDAKWAPTGAAFVRRVASSEPCGGRDVVLASPSDGTSTPIVKASELIPRDAESNKPIEGAKPLNVEDYALSDDANLVLIYTNSKRAAIIGFSTVKTTSCANSAGISRRRRRSNSRRFLRTERASDTFVKTIFTSKKF